LVDGLVSGSSGGTGWLILLFLLWGCKTLQLLGSGPCAQSNGWLRSSTSVFVRHWQSLTGENYIRVQFSFLLNGIENYEFILECVVNCAPVNDRILQSEQCEAIPPGVGYKYSFIVINKRAAKKHFGYKQKHTPQS
jgi:hypothetical protein